MTIIAKRLETVEIGKTQHFNNLTMFPLVDENPHEAHYLLSQQCRWGKKPSHPTSNPKEVPCSEQ